MKTIIYHNPRCSKSRATLQLLEENSVAPDIIKYLESPPSKKELADILKMLAVTPKELIRFNEDCARELGLSKHDERADAEWIELMTNNPMLIERPIVINDGKAVIGRPPENVLSII